MNTKRFFYSTVALILAALLLVAGVQIAIDPLFLYHKPYFGLQPVVTNERYQGAGIAKNFDYDNVIIGNSMSENFRASWFAEGFRGETVKLVAAGSHPLDWTYLLRIIEQKVFAPKRIIINLDGYTFGASTTEMKHELPEYLYNDTVLDDLNYLFNFSIIQDYTLKTLRANRKHKVPDIDSAFVWDDGNVCAEAVVKANYHSGAEGGETSVNANDLAMDNMRLLLPYIDRMCETEYIFFCSPWSMLYWRDEVRGNTIGDTETVYYKAIGELLSHPNVTVFLWNDAEMFAMMGNLDNYRDTTHYSAEVSKLIADRICAGEGKLSIENYQAEIAAFFDYIENYDYSRWQGW